MVARILAPLEIIFLFVLQPDSSGIIRQLAGTTGQPFYIRAKKLRRMLAGKQNQALCVSGQNGEGNAFFVCPNDLVTLDPHDGRYVILSPLLEVLNTEHGDRVFHEHPDQAMPHLMSNALGPAPFAIPVAARSDSAVAATLKVLKSSNPDPTMGGE